MPWRPPPFGYDVLGWIVEHVFRLQSMECLLRAGEHRPADLYGLAENGLPLQLRFETCKSQVIKIDSLPFGFRVAANVVDRVMLPGIEACGRHDKMSRGSPIRAHLSGPCRLGVQMRIAVCRRIGIIEIRVGGNPIAVATCGSHFEPVMGSPDSRQVWTERGITTRETLFSQADGNSPPMCTRAKIQV